MKGYVLNDTRIPAASIGILAFKTTDVKFLVIFNFYTNSEKGDLYGRKNS